MASNVLLITADLYTRHIHPMDKSTRTVFGDAATVTLVTRCDNSIGNFVLATDGTGSDNLIIPAGGMRLPKTRILRLNERMGLILRGVTTIYICERKLIKLLNDFNFTSIAEFYKL